MELGLWFCVFVCTTFPVQPTGLKRSKKAVMQNSTSSGQGKYAVEEAMRTLSRHLVGGCASRRKELMRSQKNLEKTLLEADISQENLTVAHRDIQTLIFRIKPKDFRGLNISSDMLTISGSVKTQTRHAMSFPTALTERARALPAKEMRLACIYLKASCLFQDEKNSSLLNDDVLGATLGGDSITNLSQPVEIRFWHNHSLANNSSMTCVFWKEGNEEDSVGTWSTKGCNTNIQEGLVVCQCDHLTYFAVLLALKKFPSGKAQEEIMTTRGLEEKNGPFVCKTFGNMDLLVQMQISPPALDEGLLVALTYITAVGCGVSAAACLLTACLYYCSRKKQQELTTQIHMHLLEALFFLNTSFLVSGLLAPATTLWSCQVAAVFLHYSLLCGLTWMALEGFHLYMLMIRVYNLYIRCYLLKLCAVGWGLPGLAVLTVFLINKQAYGIYSIETTSPHSNKAMCWITSIEVHYFNVIYFSSTMLFNVSVLTLVVRQLRRLRAGSPQQKEHSCRDVVTVLGLTCLLGTTWMLAFISFGPYSIPQLSLFTVLNSLQGLFICLWYCSLRCRSQANVSKGTSHPSQ